MLNIISFNEFKDDIAQLLSPYSGYAQFTAALDAINNVPFDPYSPKNSYVKIYDTLKNIPRVQGKVLNSQGKEANEALTKARIQADATKNAAILSQDGARLGAHFGANLADDVKVAITYHGVKTTQAVNVTTIPRRY